MAHRLGLVPIYADPRAFVFVSLYHRPRHRHQRRFYHLGHSAFIQRNVMLRFVADESRDISELQEDDTLVFKLSAW
jgi:hypothetical protein